VASAAAELAALKKAWNQVRSGVASEEVKGLLGSPAEEFKINGKLAWYYVYPGIGAGSVFFNDDGRVSSSRSPVFGFGW
jgi:outer membrane protein assembly factor BamE (lipoprotein component of BamABCDE complex)